MILPYGNGQYRKPCQNAKTLKNAILIDIASVFINTILGTKLLYAKAKCAKIVKAMYQMGPWKAVIWVVFFFFFVFVFFYMRKNKRTWLMSTFTVLSLLLKRERENVINVLLCACRQYSQIMRFFRLQNQLHTGTPPLIGTIATNRWFPCFSVLYKHVCRRVWITGVLARYMFGNRFMCL